MSGNDYAIVVGINDYAEPRMRLKGALNDATDFVAWLCSPQGGRLKPERVEPFTLLSDSSSKTPTSSEVWMKVAEMIRLARGGRLGRRLYIFFAGHGVAQDPDDSGFLTVETEPSGDLHPIIPGRGCAHVFGTRAMFEEIVVCMDCCREVDSELPHTMLPFKPSKGNPKAKDVSYNYVFATGFGQLTREVSCGTSVRGVFSRIILEGLRGEAADGSGCVTGRSLERYLRREMAKRHPGQMVVPELEPGILLATGLEPKTATVTLSLPAANLSLRVHSKGPIDVPIENLPDDRRRFEIGVGKIYTLNLVDPDERFLDSASLLVEDSDPIDCDFEDLKT